MLSSTVRKRLLIRFLFTIPFALLLQPAFGASCTTQAQMTPAQRDLLANAARTMSAQIQSGNVQALRANTIPEVSANFSGIMQSVIELKPYIEQATITVDMLYILDSTADPSSASTTEFFCGSPVVMLTFNDLPPGTYALVVLHATGVAKPQQISLILSKTPDNHWMLAGFFEKPLTQAGHDGLWYWISARKFAQAKSDWAAWFYYRQAAFLLNPIDLMSSPNFQKLQHESDAVQHSGLPLIQPMTLNAPGEAFTVTSIDITTVFGALDLEIHYTPNAMQAALLRNPETARKQVTDVMLALLGQHPDLRNAFHGMWVRADQGTDSLFALELPMDGITGSPMSQSTIGVPNIR
jgi:hypothetical protein